MHINIGYQKFQIGTEPGLESLRDFQV